MRPRAGGGKLAPQLPFIVPLQCVAEKHESPHFANLCDMASKYADVVSAADVIEYLNNYRPAAS